jgi:hypothetical protein
MYNQKTETFLFFLMAREHVLKFLRKIVGGMFTSKDIGQRYLNTKQCLKLIKDMVMMYQGDQVDIFFIDEFFKQTHSNDYILIRSFLVMLTNIYVKMVDSGLEPAMKPQVKLRKKKKSRKKFYPFGGPMDIHTYGCLFDDETGKLQDRKKNGLKETVDWFLWSDYAKASGLGKENDRLSRSPSRSRSRKQRKKLRRTSGAKKFGGSNTMSMRELHQMGVGGRYGSYSPVNYEDGAGGKWGHSSGKKRPHRRVMFEGDDFGVPNMRPIYEQSVEEERDYQPSGNYNRSPYKDNPSVFLSTIDRNASFNPTLELSQNQGLLESIVAPRGDNIIGSLSRNSQSPNYHLIKKDDNFSPITEKDESGYTLKKDLLSRSPDISRFTQGDSGKPTSRTNHLLATPPLQGMKPPISSSPRNNVTKLLKESANEMQLFQIFDNMEYSKSVVKTGREELALDEVLAEGEKKRMFKTEGGALGNSDDNRILTESFMNPSARTLTKQNYQKILDTLDDDSILKRRNNNLIPMKKSKQKKSQKSKKNSLTKNSLINSKINKLLDFYDTKHSFGDPNPRARESTPPAKEYTQFQEQWSKSGQKILNVDKRSEKFERVMTSIFKKDMRKAIDIFLSNKLEQLGGYAAQKMAYRKDYMKSKIQHKADLLIGALVEESKDGWFGLLQKSKGDHLESEYFDSVLKYYRRFRDTVDLGAINRKHVRKLTSKILAVSFFVLNFF